MRDLALRGGGALGLLLGPILVAQGRRLRRTIPRLPEAGGPRSGVSRGASPWLRLLLLGESTAAGVGASRHSEALAGQLARALTRRTGRAVAWEVVGRSGATARSARTLLLEAELELAPDVVVVALGVNDVLQMRGPRGWAEDLRELVLAVRTRCGPVPVVLAAVPPVGRFPALPQPLRGVLGLRAELLDRTARRLARELEGVVHAGAPGLTPGEEAGLFCADRFHPSPAGYTLWAGGLADAVLAARDLPTP